MKEINNNQNIYKEAAKAVGLYDTPMYNINDKKPIYFNLFNWISWSGSNSETLAGILKEELFNTEEKKIAYLQGVFEDYSGSEIQKGKNFIHFANSQQKVERCKKWLDEIARNHFLKTFITHGVIKHTILHNTIPMCHSLELVPEVVEFIKNYKI